MYPFVVIGGIKIYMTGIGILISILVFLFIVRYYSKKFNLDFWKFFNRFPICLFLTYILGSYVHYLIHYGLYFPFSINDLMIILSPYGYNFNFIGLSLGVFISFYLFLRSIKIVNEKQKRIDVLFYALALSMVVLGVFLTLGDNFIGKQTSSYLSITPFMEQSELFKFKQVYPIGGFLSAISIICFFITFIIHFFVKKHGVGIIGFVLFLLFINVVFLFQKYPRHIVFNVGDFTLDIKNYWTIFLIILMIRYYFKLNNK